MERGEAEHDASELFDAHPQPIWVHDRATEQILEANRAAEELLGRARSDLRGMRVGDVLGDGPSADLLALLREPGELRRSGPWGLVRRGRDPLDCAISTSHLVLRGQPACLVIAEDVTEHVRIQKLLAQAQRMESLGQLAGGVAHDFNNVLTVILNHAELVREELAAVAADDPARWRSLLDDVGRIVDAGERATTLTRQLLAFARGGPVEAHPVDVNEAVADAVEMLRRTLPGTLQVDVELAPALPRITAGVGQLEQVVVNLAVNARDAMPEGGRLLIETSEVDVGAEDAVDRPGLAPGRHVRLRVSDTGTGMDAATRERALEPFFTTKPRGAGTGLGLATVYGIARNAGGTVTLYSEVGVGTSVSLLLPASETSLDAPPARPAAPRPAPKATVLVVDDDETLRDLAARILRQEGYDVLTAEDGATALSLAAERPGRIDLLLTDIMMPGMSGRDVAARLYAADPDLRIVFMSGYAPRLLGDAGALPREAPVLEKPFSVAALVETASAVLATR